MGKGSKKRPNRPAKKPAEENTRDMDDEIDAFHKQRDMVPLDVEATGDSDDDADQPVFDFEGGADSDEDNSDEDDDDSGYDDTRLKGLAAKIARQAKYLQQKFGGGDDEMHEDTDEEEEKRTVWGRKKNLYYDADNVDYEIQSSDEEEPMEEEAEVVKMQKERAKALSMEDFGLEDVEQDESDTDGQEKTDEAVLVRKKVVPKLHADGNFEVGVIESYEDINKDLTALSKEEQMDMVYSSAPELVGLLSELNKSLDEIERVKPLLPEVREGRERGKMKPIEVKHVLLLAYCQAIGFYLLLKSEGHPVRDHPVIARLVEIKKLLEKMNQIGTNFASQDEQSVNHNYLNHSNESCGENVEGEREPSMRNLSDNPNDVNGTTQSGKDSLPIRSSNEHANQSKQNIQLGLQSIEMLKVKADLEAKLKLKGLYNLASTKSEKTHSQYKKPINGRFETLDDFDDEVHETAISHGMSSARLSKLSQVVANKKKHSKFVSGDEDLPERDSIGERRRKLEQRAAGSGDEDLPKKEGIGERRRKLEQRVLAAAGIDAIEDDSLGTKFMDVDVQETGGILESEDEFYKEVKKQVAEKRLAKAELYSRTPAVPPALEKEADSKRQITYQMEKNRGLTRARKKLTKNPRKKYKLKHQKAVVRRKGQVRDIRRPTGPYGGEMTGINTSVSRSIRFKS